jgi:LysR family glycine cleavage system transcriptional activator
MLQSSGHLTDFVRESVDIGIRFGRGNYPGLVVEKLLDDYYYPVVSPRFNGGKLPRTPAEMVHSPLLRCEGEPWTPWFREAGLDLLEPTGGLVFQDSSMLIRAAAEGHGIALARHAVAMTDIASGDVVRLFDIAAKCSLSYFLVCPQESLAKPQVQAFRQWMRDEVARPDQTQLTARP